MVSFCGDVWLTFRFITRFLQAYFMSHGSHFSWIFHPSRICCILQIIKYKIMHFVYSTVSFSILVWEFPLRTSFSNTLRTWASCMVKQKFPSIKKIECINEKMELERTWLTSGSNLMHNILLKLIITKMHSQQHIKMEGTCMETVKKKFYKPWLSDDWNQMTNKSRKLVWKEQVRRINI